MTRMIKQYLKRRREQKAEREYRRGFEWAMGEYYVARQPIGSIEGFPEAARTVGSYNSFDAGAEAALRVISGAKGLGRA